jgi:hypothetical protein
MKLAMRLKLYALLKYLQGMDKAGMLEVPPDYTSASLEGETLEVTLPACHIERPKGNKPDDPGVNLKDPSTSISGWAVLYRFHERLSRFNQQGVVERELVAAIGEALGQDMKIADALAALDTSESGEESLADRVEAMRQRVLSGMDKREDKTPRMLRKDDTKELPRFQPVDRKSKAAA